MADRREILLRLQEIEHALVDNKKLMEKWLSCCRYSERQARISALEGKEQHQPVCQEKVASTEICPIDMSEVDKLLAKAKSVRVSAEPTKQKSSACDFAAKNTSIKTMNSTSQASSQQRVFRPTSVPVRPRKAASSMEPLSRTSKSAVVCPRPKERITAKLEKQSVPSRSKSSKTQESGATKRNEIEPERETFQEHPDLGLLAQKASKTVSDEEKTSLTSKIVGVPKQEIPMEIVTYCKKLSSLKKKLVNSIENQSADVARSRNKFLFDVEEYFAQSDNILREDVSLDFDEYVKFGSLLKNKLESQKSMDSGSILSSIKWETIDCSEKELQRLCHLTLRYEQLKTQLECKLMISQWAKKLMTTNGLTKSEKTTAYRKLHSLLLDDSDQLPTMIDDSENDEEDDN
eukprot:Seg2743.4 transcript_id=Seg2743.4/GoldUCD/mRNA.D3Y31 product="hypothetical protein" protein_id=Seg2743.4/GoldUCD/D3Y31